jgi:F0F1-type ATP synthase assembly protein I
MNKAADSTTKPPAPKGSLNATSMFLMIADTSARLFVPSIGGTVLGLWADHSLKTTPWLTVAGVTVGSALAFLLVYLQLKAIKTSEQKESQ